MTVRTTSTDRMDIWLGTSTPQGGQSRGIYHTTFDASTGQLGDVRLAAKTDNPGFLVLHPTAPCMYVAAEKEGQGMVAAFKIEGTVPESTLELFSTVTIPEGRAAHLAVDRSGTALLTAQYHAGTTALFVLADDHAVAKHVKSIRHQGPAGIVPQRQDAPHAHWVGTSPDNQFVLVPDLGMDKILIYRFQSGPVPDLREHGFGQAPLGAGPRHLAFHPDGTVIYVANELALTVTTYRYDAIRGTMTALQTIDSISSAEKTAQPSASASEIRVHPNGQFVYAANRGPDTITVFHVDQPAKTLSVVQREPVRGSHPRHFSIDPTGRWLVAAGRDSNTLAVFEIDGETGRLSYNGHSASVPTPTCVLFGQTLR